ncbi:hypothetical protein K2173_002262 [Erythroxylum novogranatense]|uniref:Protein kinase domain-containing protein n=1 Tax=Erythroxylum novogranatense TaxID=1862640 RepID=A0AAV8TBQ5_9ROSI|nr:hypothetical protein K2173_002262 [Erythroxylum novogranatense]
MALLIVLHLLACVTFLVLVPTLALNTDGVLLLSFRYSILSDPLLVLQSWNYNDKTPCLWNGVTCSEIGGPGTEDLFRVTGVVLPNSRLLGSIPPDFGYIEHLRHLDLSNNFLNGSLPDSIFNSTELQVISLSGNEISGEIPESIGQLRSLQLLNLSGNALAGKLPEKLTTLQNLTVLSLRSNYFYGYVPGGFSSVEVLDLSSNLLNGSLPLDFGGDHLRFLNISYNTLSGPISLEFAKKIPDNATVDLSFNNLTGAIPQSTSLLNQKTESFRGNVDLCGKPLKNICSIPSTLSTPPNITTSSPAIAVIPKSINSTPVTPSSPETQTSTENQSQTRLKPGSIVAIALADVTGIALLAIVILCVYQKRKTTLNDQTKTKPPKNQPRLPPPQTTTSKYETEARKPATWYCLRITGGEETSETTISDGDRESDEHQRNGITDFNDHSESNYYNNGGKLVMVDGETKLEMETLLKSSAYILGATGVSIVYKAVLADGTAFAVRRIGDNGVERLRDFENQLRVIAKLRHPNLVRLRGFYWGDDEKLVIYDYVSYGSLASSGHRKPGSSPNYLPLEVRFKIAKGLARGLAFIHEKKYVHGNIRPSNILLNSDMEPVIADFGLGRLFSGGNYKANNSGHHFGSQRSIGNSQEHPIATSPYTGPSTSTSIATPSPYQAPESLKNLKPNAKWDVYSFGIVLLELFTGRVFSERELRQWATGSTVENKSMGSRLADVAIRSDADAKEDCVVACLKLGFSCASFAPQKRPSMKEALQALDKISAAPSTVPS